MKIRNIAKKYGSRVVAAGTSVMLVAASYADDGFDAAVAATQSAATTKATSAAGAGFAVLTVVLGLSIGFSLLSSFIKKGARG